MDTSFGPQISPLDEDDGYVSPEFDLEHNSDSEGDEQTSRPPKRSRTSYPDHNNESRSLDDDEQLALKLLGRR